MIGIRPFDSMLGPWVVCPCLQFEFRRLIDVHGEAALYSKLEYNAEVATCPFRIVLGTFSAKLVHAPFVVF